MADTPTNTERMARARGREKELRAAVAQLNALTAKVVSLVDELDSDDAWGDHQGCLSTAHFLSWQCGVSGRDGRRWVSAARKLRELPTTRQAFSSGSLSLTQVESIARVATPATDGSYVSWATQVTASQLDTLTATEKRTRALTQEKSDAVHHNRHLYTRYDDDGCYRISGLLDADAGAVVEVALDRAQDELFGNPTDDGARHEPYGARRADALYHLAESALASTGSRSGGDANQVVVHLTPEALTSRVEDDSRADLDAGVGLASETLRRLCCDATLVGVAQDGQGNVLGTGHRTRTIPAGVRRALRCRDARCRFPGCTNSRFIDAHHVVHYADGGPSRLDNLVSLCRRHHRLVHEGGYDVSQSADGTFEFKDRWGKSVPNAPPVVTAGPASPGPEVDDDTCRPKWDGSPLDYYALDVIVTSHLELEQERARWELEHRKRDPGQDPAA